MISTGGINKSESHQKVTKNDKILYLNNHKKNLKQENTFVWLKLYLTTDYMRTIKHAEKYLPGTVKISSPIDTIFAVLEEYSDIVNILASSGKICVFLFFNSNISI